MIGPWCWFEFVKITVDDEGVLAARLIFRKCWRNAGRGNANGRSSNEDADFARRLQALKSSVYALRSGSTASSFEKSGGRA
jgi:hypothetical protein